MRQFLLKVSKTKDNVFDCIEEDDALDLPSLLAVSFGGESSRYSHFPIFESM